MSTVSLAGSAALEASLGGLQRSSTSLNQASGEVYQATVDALNGESGGSTQDTVALSDAADRARSERSLENGLMSARTAGLLYTANARVVGTVMDTQQALLDTYA